MMGLTIHLAPNGLPMITPPGPRIVRTPPTSVFHWPMYETTQLWWRRSVGGQRNSAILACLDPRSRARYEPRAPPPVPIYSRFTAINPVARTIFALHYGDLLQITPPRRCWH